MSKCTNCSIELTNPIKSLEIPDKVGQHYVACRNCGKVMIATYFDGDIVELKATPNSPTIKTMMMAKQAAELFEEDNQTIQTVSLDADKKQVINLNDYKTVKEQEELSNSRERANLLTRVISKIKSLFKAS